MITQRRLSKHPSRETDGWTAKAGLLYAVRAERSNARLATVQRATARDTQGHTRTKKRAPVSRCPLTSFWLSLSSQTCALAIACSCMHQRAFAF